MPKRASPVETLAKLEERMKATKAAIKEQRQKKLLTLAEAVVAEMQLSPEFRLSVVGMLRRTIKRPSDKADIAEYLLG